MEQDPHIERGRQRPMKFRLLNLHSIARYLEYMNLHIVELDLGLVV